MNDISEEQSAINDDNRLHYFCTVLYILNNKIVYLTNIHCSCLFVCLVFWGIFYRPLRCWLLYK